MAGATGGRLAAACSEAGAVGLIGGSYADNLGWLQSEWRVACDILKESTPRQKNLGVGFITWALDNDSSSLDWLLSESDETVPHCIMLSFGDPRKYGKRIRERGAKLICQIQCMDNLEAALEAGADVIVGQGSEGGGHGLSSVTARSTFVFVQEIADALQKRQKYHDRVPLLLAAGGIADGRGLAAALCLGADGALVGSRLWASNESLATDAAKTFALAHNGDSTTRSRIFDVLRGKADRWPKEYGFRSIRNDLHREIEGSLMEFVTNPEPYIKRFEEGLAVGDQTRCHTTVGEAVGLIHDIKPAATILEQMTAEAAEVFSRTANRLQAQ